MAYDDGYYYGQCKIICESETVADNGRTVAIAGGSYNNSKALVDKIAEFLVPGRMEYTVSLLDGNVTKWSGKVQAGYGECIHVILANGYEPVMKKTYDAGIASVTGLANAAQSTANSGVAKGDAAQGTANDAWNRANDAQNRCGNLEGRLQNNISFGVDANGRWGYRKNGADPVIPFNPGFALSLGKVIGQTVYDRHPEWSRRDYAVSGAATDTVDVGAAIAAAGMSHVINFHSLTNNNFLLQTASVTTGTNVNDSAYQTSAPVVTFSYNSSNGILTVTSQAGYSANVNDFAYGVLAYSQGITACQVVPWLVITSPL